MKAQPKHNTKVQTSASGLPVRTGLQAGAWRCSDCAGKVTGNQLFKPDCTYCMQA